MSKRLKSPGSSQPIDLGDPGTPITLLNFEWRAFKDEVIPIGEAAVNVEQLQRAFYAGAQGVLHTIDRAFQEGLPPEEVGKVLPAIGVEIDRYTFGLTTRSEGNSH
jgi:hypothetical protein